MHDKSTVRELLCMAQLHYGLGVAGQVLSACCSSQLSAAAEGWLERPGEPGLSLPLSVSFVDMLG